MNIELMPGLTNVVRFPVELRVAPSMDLIYGIEPDVREVLSVSEAFFLELSDLDLREHVDAGTAEYIAEHILPLDPHERRPALDELLRPIVAVAVEACRRADRAGKRSVEAQQRLHQAQLAGSSWLEPLEPLEQAADGLLQEAAELLILAHQRCQEAHGVNRAVGMARRDQAWAPESREGLTDWLVAAGEEDRARRSGAMR